MSALNPVAWMVKAAGTSPALFHDMGQAIARALLVQGQVVPLFQGQPLTPLQLKDQAQDAPRKGTS